MQSPGSVTCWQKPSDGLYSVEGGHEDPSGDHRALSGSNSVWEHVGAGTKKKTAEVRAILL